MYADKLWIETPLIRSIHISSLLGCNAYLKLETFQPPQSFKARGISHFAQHAVRTRGRSVHLVIASSGNAGVAAAWAAKALGVKCTVYLPHGVSRATVDTMRRDGAEVVVHGNFYHEALQGAQEAVAADPNAVMVPSYNDPLLWEGHASLIHEIKDQLPEGTVPDAIFCSVGGGGLAGGIMTGCKAVGWDHVPLVGVETHGSNCFYQSLSLNEGPFVGTVDSRGVPEGTTAKHDEKHDVTVAHIAKLTSRISSLGATSPSPAVVKMALRRPGGVKSVCVSDEHTMQACLSFADDHKTLVELACSATLTPAYNPTLFRALVPPPPSDKPATVVFVLCGGYKISLQDLKEYERIVESQLAVGGDWHVALNGQDIKVPKVL